ncbi:MAG: response regulator [Thaumarchaeota archaeon]|nr:response regulator [Nitrososphaerota archaeon]
MGEKTEGISALVVDDNKEILALFIELLELKNFTVTGKAHSGKEAVVLYNSLRPDITFLDVVMPDGDGIYALEKIREVNPDAVVIMITSDLAPTTAERLEQLHASAVVYKPFDISEIVKIVKKLLSESEISQMKFFN